MNLQEHTNNILTKTNYNTNCHGLQAIDSATEIAKYYFNQENISFDNWRIREIPLVDNSGKYPVVIGICITNSILRKEITIYLTKEGNLSGYTCYDEHYNEYDFNSIYDAINHPSSNYMNHQ